MKRAILFFLLLAGSIHARQNPFVEGKMTGQLGNQMFVIAATVSLALDHGADPIFPDLARERANNTIINFQNLFYHLDTRKPRGLCRKYYEPFFYYTPIPYAPNMQIRGYFQSEKYFLHHKQEILELFKPPAEIKNYLESKYSDLLSQPNLVSFHMRFYDNNPGEEKTYIKHRREYFDKAAALFPEDALFVVFSNRMDECKVLLASSDKKCVFIQNEAYWHDLYLMSMCHHNIISNSTFSWWGAYLNLNPDKMVVAPAKWFKEESGLDERDLMPEDWIKI